MRLNEKEIIVFGSSGFIGRNLINKFLEEKVKVLASDLQGRKTNVPFLKADILDFTEVENVVKGSKTIIHLAADSLTNSLKNPRKNAQINIIGTLNILEAARKHDVERIIFSSASSVVGEVKYNPVDEKHPCKPKTPYAVAKYAIENYLRVYNEIYGMNYIIFRFFNVYGPYQTPETGGLIPNVIYKIIKNKEIPVYGDGSAVRDYIYVEDVVNFLFKATTLPKTNFIVNLGTGKGATVKEVINTCSKVIGKKPKISWKPKRPGEIDNFTADTSKLVKYFKEKPKTSLEKGIQKTYEWLKTIF